MNRTHPGNGIKKIALHWQILIALLLALLTGIIVRQLPDGAQAMTISFLEFVGKIFLQALRMLIVPLIVSSIINGVSGIGSGENVGRLGLKTLSYYVVTTLFATVVGLTTVNLFSPGISNGQPVGKQIGLSESTDEVMSQIGGHDATQLVDIFLRMVPTNIVSAAANGEMLGLIVFSLLFGLAMTRLQGNHLEILSGFWHAVFYVMMRLTEWIMIFAPIGVFALVAKVVALTGLGALKPLFSLLFTVLFALGIHFFVVLPILLKWVGGIRPIDHYKGMAPALLTAFSTSSSSATLPITMECLEKRAGLSNRMTSFVIPLGATVNMDGTALYESIVAMFIAQAYGIELGITTQFTVVLLALLTSIGVAGIPSASLVAIVIILEAVGLPIEGVGLVLGIDRLLDMCRTAVNVFSDTCGAVIIGKTEAETPYAKV